jgi:undecaprenyl-diphosphatase
VGHSDHFALPDWPSRSGSFTVELVRPPAPDHPEGMSVLEIDPPLLARLPRRSVHHVAPPTSPSRALCGPSALVRHVALGFLLLMLAATADHGWLLLRFDLPIEHFVIDHRTAWLDTAFRRISMLGSTKVVLTGGVLLALASWRRCRLVSALVVAATITRPLVEHLLKIAVQRPRPDLDRMVPGVGYSFPSGHVMAAATLWLMVPVVVSLYRPSRRVWWVTTVTSLTVVGLISLSRLYLGVHWASDVVAGALAAAVLLAGLDLGFRWIHEHRRCPGSNAHHLEDHLEDERVAAAA